MNVEEAIQKLFISKGWTVATAESCTGGAIAAHLTAIPDSSRYFQGGMVTYSNEMKVRWLGVAEQTLKLYGAVSEQVAIEMAQGVLQRAESTFALAVTGIAGPTGATPDKPIGMVCGAIAQIGAPTYAFTFHCPGDRKAVITASTGKMLNALLHSAQQRSAVSQ